MQDTYRLDQIADDVLLTSLKRLTGTSNELTAQLLAHLAEVEARGIHRNMACASLYTYCVYELRLSEDEAQRRCRAARACRQFPQLLAMLAEASIHLTGILLLAPHLTDDNHAELLARARFRTKREIEKLVAEVAPRDDAPARIEPLRVAGPPGGGHALMMAALCGPVRNLPAGNARGEAPVGALAELTASTAARVTDDLLPPISEAPPPATFPAMQFKVQFTADQGFMDLLDEARDLLAHELPTRDFVAVQRKALEVLVAQLRKRKYAARAGAARSEVAEVPRTADELEPVESPAADVADSEPSEGAAKRRRRPPAAVAREVWQRDGGRCTFADARGQRCRETSKLEFHHIRAFALGGATTVDNLTLRCCAHNALAAEHDFGIAHMQRARSREATTVTLRPP